MVYDLMEAALRKGGDNRVGKEWNCIHIHTEGDPLKCGNYREIKVLEHLTMISEVIRTGAARTHWKIHYLMWTIESLGPLKCVLLNYVLLNRPCLLCWFSYCSFWNSIMKILVNRLLTFGGNHDPCRWDVSSGNALGTYSAANKHICMIVYSVRLL